MTALDVADGDGGLRHGVVRLQIGAMQGKNDRRNRTCAQLYSMPSAWSGMTFFDGCGFEALFQVVSGVAIARNSFI